MVRQTEVSSHYSGLIRLTQSTCSRAVPEAELSQTHVVELWVTSRLIKEDISWLHTDEVWRGGRRMEFWLACF